MKQNSKGIAVTVAIVAAIGVSLLAMLAVLNRKDQTVGLKQEIQYDDFAFSVQGIRKASSLGSGESQTNAEGVYYVVTLKIARITQSAWTSLSRGRPRFWWTILGESFTCQKTRNGRSNTFRAPNAAVQFRQGPRAQPSSPLNCLKTLKCPCSGSRKAARSGTSSISFSTGRRESRLDHCSKKGAHLLERVINRGTNIMAMRSFDIATADKTSNEDLLLELDLARLPRHVAIIMDGNGRWAARRSMPRVVGHRAGADAVRRTVETSARLGLECLTLYAFSTENWKRPRFEIRALMDLLIEYLRKELHSLKENNIRFRMIGRSEELHISVLEQIRKAELSTFQNTGMRLNIALNYGGRAEIVDAVRKLAREVAAGRVQPDEVDEELICGNLYTRALPDPDLLIRTSGEMRVSNFLLWQIAYAEIHVTETLWPDFGERDLFSALIDYQKRDRRYGRIAHLEEVPA